MRRKGEEDNALLLLGKGGLELGEALLHLLNRRDTRRVDVVESGTDEVLVRELVERLEELEVRLGGLLQDDEERRSATATAATKVKEGIDERSR